VIKLLGRPTSINVRKVLWLCAELPLQVDHEPEWATPSQPTKAPQFLALNPNALVPVLIDGDFVLWESNTICRYLAGRQGRDDLLPRAPAARARVEQWMDWQATELNSAWRHAFLGLVRGSPQHQDRQAIADSAAQWNRLMQILERQLDATAAYAAGASFTLADIVLGVAAQRWRMTPIERPVLPAVQAWLERLARRAPFREQVDNGVA
jgi:glutathione S-transferase